MKPPTGIPPAPIPLVAMPMPCLAAPIPIIWASEEIPLLVAAAAAADEEVDDDVLDVLDDVLEVLEVTPELEAAAPPLAALAAPAPPFAAPAAAALAEPLDAVEAAALPVVVVVDVVPETAVPAEAALAPLPVLAVDAELEAAEAEAALAPSPSTVVVVLVVESLGNEVLSKSRAVAPSNENGFVIALSNQAPVEAPPDAIKFSAVPATLAIGLETVSSICDLIPSANTLLALDKLVAIFWMATPAVVTGLPTVSL